MARSFYFLFPNHRLPEAPKIGQHVRIEGQPGMYIVLRLDTKRFAADLMLMTGNHEIEQRVPYSAIEPVRAADNGTENRNSTTAKSEDEAATTI